MNTELSLSFQEDSLVSTPISFSSPQPPATSVCCILMLPGFHKELYRDATNICCARNPKRTSQGPKDRSCYQLDWCKVFMPEGIALPSKVWPLGGRSGKWGQKRLPDFLHLQTSMQQHGFVTVLVFSSHGCHQTQAGHIEGQQVARSCGWSSECSVCFPER